MLSHCSLKHLTHCDECRATAYWTQLQTALHNSLMLSNNTTFNNRILLSNSDTNYGVSDTIPTISLHCCCFFIIRKGTRQQQTHSQMTVTYNNDSSYHRFHLETFEYIRSFSDRNDHIFGPICRTSQTHPVTRTERLEHIANIKQCVAQNQNEITSVA